MAGTREGEFEEKRRKESKSWSRTLCPSRRSLCLVQQSLRRNTREEMARRTIFSHGQSIGYPLCGALGSCSLQIQVYNTQYNFQVADSRHRSASLVFTLKGSSTFSARLEADAFCGFSINPRTARPTATPFPPPRTKLFVPSQRSLCEHFHFHLHHWTFLQVNA